MTEIRPPLTLLPLSVLSAPQQEGATIQQHHPTSPASLHLYMLMPAPTLLLIRQVQTGRPPTDKPS